jgi:hypothetical protein
MPFCPISIGDREFFHSAPTRLIPNLTGESLLAHTHFTILNNNIIELTNYCSQLSTLIYNLQNTMNSIL